MNLYEAGLLPLIGFICGASLFIFGFKRWKLRRALRRLVVTGTRSGARGLVKLQGRAEPFGSNKDPIYGQECAFFYVLAQEKYGQEDEDWRTLYEASTRDVPFFLRDVGGRAVIYPVGAEADIVAKVKFNSESRDEELLLSEADGPTRAFVKRLERRTDGFPIKVVAQLLRPGEPIYVIGAAAPSAEADISVRPTPTGYMYMSDKKPEEYDARLELGAAVGFSFGMILTIGSLTLAAWMAGLL